MSATSPLRAHQMLPDGTACQICGLPAKYITAPYSCFGRLPTAEVAGLRSDLVTARHDMVEVLDVDRIQLATARQDRDAARATLADVHQHYARKSSAASAIANEMNEAARLRGEGRPCGGCGGCTSKHWHENICVGSHWHATKEVVEAVEQKRELPPRSSRQDLLTLGAVAKVLGWSCEPEEVLPAIKALKEVPFQPAARCAWLSGHRHALCAEGRRLASGDDADAFDAHVLACAGPEPGQAETPEQG